MQTNTVTDLVVALHIPVSKVNVVLAGLRELPYKVSADLIHSITAQAQREVDKHSDFLASAQATEPTQAATSSQQPEQ